MVRIKSLSESLSRMDCDRKKETARKRQTEKRDSLPERDRQTDRQTDEVFGGLALPLHCQVI